MTQRKKVAIVTTHPIQYYAPLFRLLAVELDIHVFYTWPDGSKPKYDPGFGKIIEWDIPLLDDYQYSFVKNTSKNSGSSHFGGIINPTLNQEIENFNPDSIIIFGWSYQSHLKAMWHFKGKIPIYFRGDSTLLDQKSGWKNIARSIVLKLVYKLVDKAFYVGTNNYNYFKKYGLKDNQLIFAPHSIDNNRFESENDRQYFRSKISIKDDQILLGFIGKFENKKNPSILIKIAKQFKDKNISVVFVGNGVLENQLKESAKELNNVYFLPFVNQSEITKLYQSIDVLVLPSLGPNETWGLVVNEAMAAGKSVIVSNKSGCAIDLVKNHKNGYIFNPEIESELENAITQLISNPDQVKKFGQYSKEIIQNWSFTEASNKIVAELTQ